jgi:hypothetical protein
VSGVKSVVIYADVNRLTRVQLNVENFFIAVATAGCCVVIR